MTASMTNPAETPKTRPIRNFARRLGVQAVLSVTVMVGLQLASVNGYDVRDLLPAPQPETVGPAGMPTEPVHVVGVPARFDIPVQAGGTFDRPSATSSREEMMPTASSARQTRSPATLPEPTRIMAAMPSPAHVIVPTPRPRLVAETPAAPPPRPSDLPFDVSPRGIEVYGVAELAEEEAPPVPIPIADTGFRVGDLVPSGEAILTRTAEVTGSAAHAVTGTASRILDLVR